MASTYGTQYDPKTGDEIPCVLMPDDYDNDNQAYALYFVTAESEETAECQEYYNTLSVALGELYRQNQIAYFVVVGSADKQGEGSYNNKQLSSDRYSYAIENILPYDADIREEGWVAGAATDIAFSPDTTDSWKYRSVYIYPVWKRQKFACSDEFRSGIETNIALLEEASEKYPDEKRITDLLDNYKNALAKCGDTGTKLDYETWDEISRLVLGSLVLMEQVQHEYNVNLTSFATDITLESTISMYYSTLSELRKKMGVSKWRNAEGKFNTARLASDSIAGVVLGTVGGIVTSKLVKKNQLKKGFEDLSCHVGGQKIADYGDTFRVGLQ